MTTLADIATNNHDFADWMFLLAMVLALVAAAAGLAEVKWTRYAAPVLALAVAALSLAWLSL